MDAVEETAKGRGGFEGSVGLFFEREWFFSVDSRAVRMQKPREVA